MNENYDAELREVVRVGPVLYGVIYNDTKGRFEDGTHVTTSFVKWVEEGIAQTLNTRYKIQLRESP